MLLDHQQSRMTVQEGPFPSSTRWSRWTWRTRWTRGSWGSWRTWWWTLGTWSSWRIRSRCRRSWTWWWRRWWWRWWRWWQDSNTSLSTVSYCGCHLYISCRSRFCCYSLKSWFSSRSNSLLNIIKSTRSKVCFFSTRDSKTTKITINRTAGKSEYLCSRFKCWICWDYLDLE